MKRIILLVFIFVCSYWHTEGTFYKGFYNQNATFKLSGARRAISIKPLTKNLVLSENDASKFRMKLLKPNPKATNRTSKDRLYLNDEFKILYGTKSVYADSCKRQLVTVWNGKYSRFKLTQKYSSGCDPNSPEYEIMYQKDNYNRNPDLCSFELGVYSMCTGRCGKRVLWVYVDGGWKRVGRDKMNRATWVALKSGWSNYEFELPI